jgi:predicted nucleotidyltransferase
MVTQEQIRILSDDIVWKFHPDKVVLFGSYAYGTPTDDSDVDLLVVLPYEGRRSAKAIEIRRAVDVSFPLDLLPYTADYLTERLQLGDFFLQEVVERGSVIYESSRA